MESSSNVKLVLSDSYFFRIKCNDDGIACLYAKRGAEQECKESVG